MIMHKGCIVPFSKHSDGALRMTYNEPDNDIPENVLTWFYDGDEELFPVLCLIEKLGIDTLLMPYVPHARMDRAINPEDVFTLKHFANLINTSDVKKVLTLDAHSNVTPALLNGHEALPLYLLEALIERAREDGTVIVFPDEGASKRYSKMCGDLPNTFLVKTREWGTNRILSTVLMNPEMVTGKDVLMVDDICSYGNTFVLASEHLKEAGANNIDLYVTHSENAILKGGMVDSCIRKVYTTNTIYRVVNEPKTDKRGDKLVHAYAFGNTTPFETGTYDNKFFQDLGIDYDKL